MSREAKPELEALHLQSSHHRGQLEEAGEASCFFCCAQRIPMAEIVEWCDKGHTAICPRCGVDALLPGTVVRELLHRMQDYWFTPLDTMP